MVESNGLENVIAETMSRAEAEMFAANHGVYLTRADHKRIGELEREAVAQQGVKEQESLLDWLIRQTPKLLNAIEKISEILFTLMRAIIVAFGVLIVLILLLFVEQQRVTHGIQLFEVNTRLANFGAWALVILNLVLEFTIEYVEHRANYQQEANKRFSLRIWAQNLQYTVGLSKEWKPQLLSPAHRHKKLLRIVTFTILMLALSGSMKDIILVADGTWYVALRNILFESDLHLMVTWLVGLLFASAAVFAAQDLSRYIAVRCVEIIEKMNEVPTEDVEAQVAREHAAVQFILAKVSNTLAKKTLGATRR